MNDRVTSPNYLASRVSAPKTSHDVCVTRHNTGRTHDILEVGAQACVGQLPLLSGKINSGLGCLVAWRVGVMARGFLEE